MLDYDNKKKKLKRIPTGLKLKWRIVVKLMLIEELIAAYEHLMVYFGSKVDASAIHNSQNLKLTYSGFVLDIPD